MSHVYLVTVPNNKENPKTTFDACNNRMGTLARCFRFEIPSLTVGTLDSLMALSDELSKNCAQVENVVRKVERQYADVSSEKAQPLRVNDKAVEESFYKFSWDIAQYQHEGKALSELVSQTQSIAAKVDDELKLISTSCVESAAELTAAKRRKTVNVMTSDFEDFLKPTDIAKIDVQETESLLTVMVVVPKSLENEFLANYHNFGSEIACFGGPDWTNSTSVGSNDGNFGPSLKNKRSSVKGSPVVPKSAQKVFEEGETALYALTILRGHYQAGHYVDDVFNAGCFVDYLEPVKNAFREKRFIIRELKYDASKAGGIDSAINQATEKVKQSKTNAIRWCKTNFGEVFTAWLHLRVIQGFVESVLRYGLPVDFVSFFLEPDMKREKDTRAALLNTILNLRPDLKPKRSFAEDDEEDAEADNLPFVCLKCSVIGAATPSNK